MRIRISVTGVVDDTEYPLDALGWMLWDLRERVEKWANEESTDGVEYPLEARVEGEFGTAWMECRIEEGEGDA